ncbi:MAG: protein-L-isoaspartate(D-aspartate) O-methyltransferase [Planctomycetia bacterium]|nr:protein-L-isoaspartate(D-aspartate) O-methyltransferase [Planctomycetia bacterium]
MLLFAVLLTSSVIVKGQEPESVEEPESTEEALLTTKSVDSDQLGLKESFYSKDFDKKYPIVPEAEQMVLEVLVPTKQLHNLRVLDAVRRIPRIEFVPKAYKAAAYMDYALPIGESQTISPPFVVAYMTEQLDPQPTDKVLEIGTGSGYQAAVLSPLVRDVYTIEIVPSLGRNAAKLLRKLGYLNVHVKVGDGYEGWPEAAPFDKIIVTCSPEEIPQPLIDQLKEGGKILIPTGERYNQQFYICVKNNGEITKQALIPAFFVPMTGEAEKKRIKLPDPLNPTINGGTFEDTIGENKIPNGWYYLRNAKVEKAPYAPEGQNILVFDNHIILKQQRLKEVREKIDRYQKMQYYRNSFDYLDNYVTEEQRRTERQRLEELTAHAYQGFPINGQKVRKIDFSCWMRGEELQAFGNRQTVITVVLNFFDEDRKSLNEIAIVSVPNGSFEWREVQQYDIQVPRTAVDVSIRIGILNGTGHLEFDDIKIEKSPNRR